MGFGGTFPPENVSHRPKHKRTVLGRNHVILAIKHEYRRAVLAGRVKNKKGQHKTGQENKNSSGDEIAQCSRKLPEFAEITQNNGHYAVQGHSRSSILVPIESS